jgi:3-phenylpropionate/trans-cinnamate dioxygenase ferredoxin subunit
MADVADKNRQPGRPGRFVVARAKDVPEGTRLLVQVLGREIGIFNIGGRFHAILNRCPHRGAELCKGDIIGRVDSDGPGEMRLDTTQKFLVCPWHAWEFDIETGESWRDRGAPDGSKNYVDARSYGLGVSAGDKLAAGLSKGDTEISTADAEYVDPVTHRVRGPYEAQILPVDVDDEYIVLSLTKKFASEKDE